MTTRRVYKEVAGVKLTELQFDLIYADDGGLRTREEDKERGRLIRRIQRARAKLSSRPPVT